MREFTISDREAGQRMDKYLRRMLSAAPQSFVYKMLRKKNIVLNGAKASGSEILKAGDVLALYLSEETFTKFAPAFADEKPEAFSPDSAENKANREEKTGRSPKSDALDIVYEDEDILIFNKPAGLLSQKAKPGDDSANDRVISYLLDSGQITEEELRTFHPSVCNRLDRNTAGLLIAGKTMRGLRETAELLRGRELAKYYHALVAGAVEEEARLCGFLVKDEAGNRVRLVAEGEGDSIETAYRPLARYGDATLLEVRLITGKPHQIRAHLSSVGHPVLGDAKYGDADLNRALRQATGLTGQLLVSCRMEFPDGRIVEIPDPETFSVAEAYLTEVAGNL